MTVLPGASHAVYPPNVDNDARTQLVSLVRHENLDNHAHVENESVSTSLCTHDNPPVNAPCHAESRPETVPRKSRWGSRVASIAPTSFVPAASHVSQPTIPMQTTPGPHTATGYPETSLLPLVSSIAETNAPVPSSEAPLEDRKSHAIQIARKFNQEQQQLSNIQGNNRFIYGSVGHDQYQTINASVDASLGRNYTDTLAAEYSTKRRAFWERFEMRKRKATMKNLEFVAQRQVELANQRIAQLEETRIQEREIESYHDAMFKSRANASKSMRMSSVAGLGTQERHAQEQKRKQVISKASDTALAIYVAGLVADDGPPNKSTEETMRALFGCYGEIRKIHFYLDKQTGKRKGDALVIYNLSANNDDMRRSLVETVCSQVRFDMGTSIVGISEASSMSTSRFVGFDLFV